MDKEAYNELRRIPKAMEYGTERRKAAHKAFNTVKKMNKRRQQDEAFATARQGEIHLETVPATIED